MLAGVQIYNILQYFLKTGIKHTQKNKNCEKHYRLYLWSKNYTKCEPYSAQEVTFKHVSWFIYEEMGPSSIYYLFNDMG